MVITIVVLACLGLIFGSFVEATVWRLHERETKGKKLGKEYSILTGRSMCPHCHHTLAAKDLIPVFSWLWLRGKCRYCHKAITWQPLVIELVTAGLFVWSWLAWPHALHGSGLFALVAWLVFVIAFVALAVYDLRWFKLPNKIVVPLNVLVAIEVVVLALWEHSWTDLWQPAVAMAIIVGLFWALFQFSGGSWLGGGDVKLAFALGLIAGSPLMVILLLFLSSVLGTLSSLPLVLKGKGGMKARVPFGPYLLAAAVIVQLYGHHIVSWYQGLLI